MISWLIIIVGLIVSWYYVDLNSASSMQSILCPIFIVVFTLAFFIKACLRMALLSTSGVVKDKNGPFGGFGGDGGCGSGDGGC